MSIDKQVEEKIKAINKKIDTLQERAEGLPSNVKQSFDSNLKDLEKKRNQLEHKLKSFKNVTKEAYSDIKTGFKLAVDDLNASYINAKNKFEQINDVPEHQAHRLGF